MPRWPRIAPPPSRRAPRPAPPWPTALQAAQADSDAKAAALNARLNAQVAEAEARIDASRTAAMGALRGVAIDTTEALLTKLVGRADRAAVDAAVTRELAARGRA